MFCTYACLHRITSVAAIITITWPNLFTVAESCPGPITVQWGAIRSRDVVTVTMATLVTSVLFWVRRCLRFWTDFKNQARRYAVDSWLRWEWNLPHPETRGRDTTLRRALVSFALMHIACCEWSFALQPALEITTLRLHSYFINNPLSLCLSLSFFSH